MALLETLCSATSCNCEPFGSRIATTACVTPVCAASQSMARRADAWTSTLDSRNSARLSLGSDSMPATGTPSATALCTAYPSVVDRLRAAAPAAFGSRQLGSQRRVLGEHVLMRGGELACGRDTGAT